MSQIEKSSYRGRLNISWAAFSIDERADAPNHFERRNGVATHA